MTAFKSFKTIILLTLLLLVQLSCTRHQPQGPKVKRLGFIALAPADFWTIARKGAEKADAELDDVVLDFRVPADGTAANQTPMINDVSKQVLVITQDSDAPQSDRACYIGTDNRAAGRQAGELIKEALPNGGKIMIFVGRRDAQNAHERYQGIKDVLAGTKVEILDVRTDDIDRVRAKTNVSDTLVKYPDVAGLVGLWAYNGPAILGAVEDAGKVGQVKIVTFDEEDQTLAGVKSGAIYATVVQQPFEFGYRAIRMMATVLGGDKSVIPANKQAFVETLVIKKNDVDPFVTKLNQLRGR